MNVYITLTAGLDEVLTTAKYKSPVTRRIDICNRYNTAIAALMQQDISDLDRAKIRGVKGLITKTIVDSLNDDELEHYINCFVKDVLMKYFGDYTI